MHTEIEIDARGVAERLRVRAIAFLDAAEHLCQDMDKGCWTPTYDRGQPALWLAFHAVELFMKACIWERDQTRFKSTHSLGELNLILAELDPELEIAVPFGPEPVRADYELMQWALKCDREMHQQPSYPIDRDGATWSGVRGFSAELFSAELTALRKELDRVSHHVFGEGV